MKISVSLFLLLLLGCQCSFAQQDQQQKDFEQKQRIYGTKHPWENTAPYGTQYTPPQAGGPTANQPEEPQTGNKPAAAKSTKKVSKRPGHKTVSKPKAPAAKTPSSQNQ